MISSSSSRRPCEPVGVPLVQLGSAAPSRRRGRPRRGSGRAGSGSRRRPGSASGPARCRSRRTSERSVDAHGPLSRRVELTAPARELLARSRPPARAPSAPRSAAGRGGPRAARGSWAGSPLPERPSTASASICSTNSGLPSAPARIRSRSLVVDLRRRGLRRGAPESSPESGSSATHERAGRGPGRPVLEQLRPREAEDEQRRVGRPADHVLDEVEQRRLGPLQVVDQRRPPAARRRVPRTAGVPPRTSPRRRAAPPRWRRRPASLLRDPAPRPPRLSRNCANPLLAQAPSRRQDDPAQRPVGDALAVRRGSGPTSVVARSRAWSRTARCASRDLPMPAGPDDRRQAAAALALGCRPSSA